MPGARYMTIACPFKHQVDSETGGANKKCRNGITMMLGKPEDDATIREQLLDRMANHVYNVHDIDVNVDQSVTLQDPETWSEDKDKCDSNNRSNVGDDSGRQPPSGSASALVPSGPCRARSRSRGLCDVATSGTAATQPVACPSDVRPSSPGRAQKNHQDKVYVNRFIMTTNCTTIHVDMTKLSKDRLESLAEAVRVEQERRQQEMAAQSPSPLPSRSNSVSPAATSHLAQAR